MVTDFFSIPYDEEALTDAEIEELNEFAYSLYSQFETKISEMGLTLVEGFGIYVSKFSQEELDSMPKVRRNKDGRYELIK